MKKENVSLKKIVAIWKNLNVPEIEVRAFDYETDRHQGPWHFKDNPNYIPSNSNPHELTARHLVVLLKDKPEGLKILYKLYAFVCNHHGRCQYAPVFSELFKAFNEDLNWWPSNAKHLIPSPSEVNTFYNYGNDFKNFSDIIHKAAAFWTAMSQEYVIVRTPDLMDRNSEEFKEFQQKSSLEYEQREFRRYLELRKKFGVITSVA